MADSTHEEILDAVEARLATLDLGGMEVARVLSLAEVATLNVQYPCLLVSPEGIEQALPGTTSQEDYRYPVTLRIVYRSPVADVATGMQVLRRRKQVRDEFQRKPLVVAAGEGYAMLMQPSPVVDPDAAAYQLLASRLNWLVNVLEARP